MSDSSVEGSCLCGQVRFRITLPTQFCAHCHCTMCQRNHGASYVTWFGIDRGQLDVHAGDDALRRYESSVHGTRSFCERCGTSLFCESTHHPERVDVTLASMHGPIDLAPQLHCYFSDRADWVAVGDTLPRLGGKTGVEPLDEDAG